MMKAICLLVAMMCVERAAFAVAWVDKHDMTGASYQTEFDRWTAPPYNLRLTCISGYEEAGAARYAAIWENVSGPAWSAGHGMTAAQFNTTTATMDGQGYEPAFVSGFTVGGTPYYNAIWEYQPRADIVAQVGMSRSSLIAANSAKASLGYTLIYVSTFTDSGAEVYAAIWSKGASSSSYQCRFGLSATAWQAAFNDLAGQGFRLISTTVSLEGTAERYSGVFRKPFGTGWYSYAGLSEINYQSETANAYYTGYRPSFVSVYTKNNTSWFNAIWTYNGGLKPGDAAPIHNAINKYMSDNDVPGLSVAISRNGRLVFAKGFGLADTSINQWVDPDNRFRIASVSKPITATAMLTLRDAGTLTSLDNTVFGTGALLGTTYGSVAYTTREKAITVRHLLQHTTGWSNVLDGVWQVGTSNPGDAVDWQLDNTNPLYTPGTAYDYMNTDYLAAGRVIEALSGKTYEQYVKDEVLAPCGITTTMEIGNKTFVGRKLNEVVYYQPGGGDPYNLDPHRMDANGGWIARPMDLLLLMRRIDGLAINTDIISGARLTEMITGSAASGGSYGLGMLPNGSWWGHNGCMDGTIAFLVHRTDGIDFAVTCNTRPATDSCAWTLRSVLNTAINTVADTAWPDFDLFPSVNVAYDDWTVQTFPYWARFEPGLREDFWGPEADWDGDRIQNLFEAYFNMDPLTPNHNGLPFKTLKDQNDFVVRWGRSLLSPTHGVQVSSEYKSNLGAATWNTGPAVISSSIGFGFINYETRTPIVNGGHRFQRFKAFAP